MRGPTLHVAALPFPSWQGTQAVLARMLAASADDGRETHLLCYAHGHGTAPRGVHVHRIADLPRVRSMRSGPSAAKLVLDASLAASLWALARELQPELIVAHHVEAAAVAAALPIGPVLFFAHTDLGAELPAYGPAALAEPLRMAGRALDRTLIAGSDAVATISPLLAERLAARVAGAMEWVRYVPAPWGDGSAGAGTRTRTRTDAAVVLYTGNLDAYQGLPLLLEALSMVREPVTLVVGTPDDPAPLQRAADAAGVRERVRVEALHTEEQRAALHAEADVAVIPRTVPGGLPIKLLDALARGLPPVVTRAAAGGLALPDAIFMAEAGPLGLARAIEDAVTARDLELRAMRARAYVQRAHTPQRYLAALDRQAELARRRHRGRVPALRAPRRWATLAPWR